MPNPKQIFHGILTHDGQTARLEIPDKHLVAQKTWEKLGGTFEQVALLAKEALVELHDGPHPDPLYAGLEESLLAEINRMGIGPQGFGGKTSALAVRIKAAPTHIAGLPVAVNVGCHVTRHASETL